MGLGHGLQRPRLVQIISCDIVGFEGKGGNSQNICFICFPGYFLGGIFRHLGDIS